MSIRTRVGLVAFLSTLAMVFVAAVLALAIFRREGVRSIDTSLEGQWQAVADTALTIAAIDRPRLEALLGVQLESAQAIRVLSDGEAVLALGQDRISTFPPTEGILTSYVEGERWRVLTRPVDTPAVLARGRNYVVQVALPLTPLDDSIRLLRRAALRSGWVIALLAGLIGWLASGQVVRPLTALRERMEEIGAVRTLSDRVGPVSSDPDVGRLARAFDDMLERLERADIVRQEALGSARAFGAAAAHELRTPLTSIAANVEVLATHPDLPTETRTEIVQQISSEQARLQQLLEALRLLARGDVAGTEVFAEADVGDLVSQSLDRFRRRHPEIVVTGDVTELGTFDVWYEGLTVAVDNLLENAAVHGTGSDGVARVDVETRREQDSISITVGDAGPGLAPDLGDRVFERFVTAGPRGGTGLGLALVAQQAHLHGGEVAVSRSHLGGAAFTITIRGARTAL